MEKLKPVLKQFFWICTGLVVLLAVSGWLLATGSLQDQIKRDGAKLETAKKDAAAGEQTPNSVYTNGAKQINEQHQSDFELAERQLHDRQIKYRTYPESIKDELPRSFGAPIAETALRNQYAKLYDRHFTEQLRVLDPFIVQDNKGTIAVAVEGITHEDVSQWFFNPPTASEIWNAQEDLWLLRSLFESIAKVNADSGAERLASSPVRQLMTLYLRGGARVAAGVSGGGFGGRGGGRGGFGGFGVGAAEDAGDEDFGGGGGGGGRRGRRGGAGGRGGAAAARSNAGASFAGSFTNDLVTEEFGPDPLGGMGARGGSSYGGDDEGDEDFGGGGFGFGGRGGGGGAAAAAAAGPGAGRYVDEEAEYRTRAFLLHAKVEPEAIPALLTGLTNSSFPVEIVRVDTQFRNTGGTRSPGVGRSIGYGGDDGDEDFDGGGFGGGGRSGIGMMLGGANPGGLLGRGGRRGPGLGAGTRGAPGRGGRGRRGRGAGAGDENFGGRRGGGSDYLAALANETYDPNLEAKGFAQYSAAVGDPLLAEVRIAGLVTVYRTKEENETVEETVEMEVKEAEAAAVDASQQSAVQGDAVEDAAGTKSSEQEEDAAAGDEASDTPASPGTGDEDSGNGEPGEATPADPGETADTASE